MNAAQAIAKCLSAEGVKTVFGYPGVAICPVFDAILETDIRQVLVRTEANAAHAASGYARISGQPGVAICTSGPGATNLITGIATAYADSIPLVCITGQVNSDLLGSDVFQEADITGAAESFVKYSYLVRDAAEIPRVFKEAFYIASTGRRGPVLIDIPMDVQLTEMKKFAWPEEVSLRTYKPTVKGNLPQLKKLMKALENSHRPLICVGGGVHLSGAAGVLRKFAEKHQVPVVTTMMGISVMPSDHPLYMGMIGNNGRPSANLAVTESDLVIMVGARLADRAVNQPDIVTHNKVMVHIDVDPAEIGKNAPSTIPIVGDINAVFTDLLTLDGTDADHEPWRLHLAESKAKKQRRTKAEGFVDPTELVRKLSLAMAPGAVYVADVGQNQIWSCRNVMIREGGRFLTSGGMGTMGYAIPAAMGAKMAAPERQVVAVCGDGAFQMSMMELATMQQHGVAVKVIVMNNGTLGMVREYQKNSYAGRYTMVSMQGSPRLDKLAEAYDLPYLRVETMADLDEKISEFLAAEGSILMECLIDPMDTVK